MSKTVELQTTHGVIRAELDDEKAPQTVANFLAYVKAGHYDGTVFHRVIPGFMIQGGGFESGMRQKPTQPPVANEADNGLRNDKYTLAMARTSVPDSARPFNTYFEDGRDFPYNGEAVLLYHDPSARTDGGSMVMFRRSDVIVAGDAFVTTSYPVIDTKNGGSVAGIIRSLNRILELAVPSTLLQEGGTYIIPGHGRIADEADVVEYRDMVVIVSERIADLVKKGMTLAQVTAARPTLDYDARYGADTGAWTTGMFVEAIYNEMKATR